MISLLCIHFFSKLVSRPKKKLSACLSILLLWVKSALATIKNLNHIALFIHNFYLNFYFKFRFFSQKLLAKSTSILTLAYFLTILAIEYLLWVYGPHPLLSSKIANEFFSTVGGMIGATPALIFMFSLFVIQNSSDKYSPSLIRIYSKNFKEKLIFYVLAVLSIFCFILGLLYSHNNSSDEFFNNIGAHLGILSIGISFWIIWKLYTDMKRKIDPENALQELKKQIKYLFLRIVKDSKKLSKFARRLKKKHQIIEELNPLVEMNSETLIISYQREVDKLISEFFEILRKMIDRNEIENSKNTISSISEIISDYLILWYVNGEIHIVPDHRNPLIFTTNISKFICFNLENFISLGETLIKSDKDEIVKHLLKQFSVVAEKANDCKIYNPNPRFENPILTEIIWLLNYFIGLAQSNEKTDLVIKGFNELNIIGRLTINKKYTNSIVFIQNAFLKYAEEYVMSSKELLTKVAIDNWLDLLNHLMINKLNTDHFTTQTVKRIAKICIFHQTYLKKDGLERASSIQNIQCNPYSQLINIFQNQLNNFEKLDQNQKKQFKNSYIEFLTQLRLSFREIATHEISFDYIFISEVKRIIYSLCISMLEIISTEKCEHHKSSLTNELSAYLHLSAWFFSNKKVIERSDLIIDLSDVISSVGLEAMSKNMNHIVIDAVKAIAWLSELHFSKIHIKNPFAPPKLILGICYIGILGMKIKDVFVLKLIKGKIKDFETRYALSYPANTAYSTIEKSDKSELRLEVEDLKRNLVRPGTVFDRERPNQFLYNKIENSDIDAFIFEIWGEEAPLNSNK